MASSDIRVLPAWVPARATQSAVIAVYWRGPASWRSDRPPVQPRDAGHSAAPEGGKPTAIQGSGNRQHLDLEERAGDEQAGYLNGCDGRRCPGEACRSYLAVLGKLAHVGEVGADVDHIGEGGAAPARILSRLEPGC